MERTHVIFSPLTPQVTSFAAGATAALGPNIFTDIAFEPNINVPPTLGQRDLRRVFVSSASGAMFEIDYDT